MIEYQREKEIIRSICPPHAAYPELDARSGAVPPHDTTINNRTSRRKYLLNLPPNMLVISSLILQHYTVYSIDHVRASDPSLPDCEPSSDHVNIKGLCPALATEGSQGSSYS